MLNYLFSHPFILLMVTTFFMVVIMFIVIKPNKKKKVKSNKKVEEKKKEEPAEQTEVKPDENKETAEEKTEEPKQKKVVKKAKEKPKIEPVFQKKVEKKETVETEEVVSDDGIETRAQFVKTSNKVSKFVGLRDVSEMEELAQDSLIQELPLEENCEVCEKVSTHFDHSRRLSKIVKEDLFDQMFAEHLSSHYLNIDEKRHLRISDNFSEKLYDRAIKTLSNSDVKLLIDEDKNEGKPVDQMKNDKKFMREWLENRKKEEYAKIMANSTDEADIDDETADMIAEDVDISVKNIVVVDSLLNRKGKRNTKK